MAPPLPPRRLRLELLDYPGEWLLDLPLLAQDFSAWSAATLRRLEGRAGGSRDFLGFVRGLPAGAPADEALAADRASRSIARCCCGCATRPGSPCCSPAGS